VLRSPRELCRSNALPCCVASYLLLLTIWKNVVCLNLLKKWKTKHNSIKIFLLWKGVFLIQEVNVVQNTGSFEELRCSYTLMTLFTRPAKTHWNFPAVIFLLRIIFWRNFNLENMWLLSDVKNKNKNVSERLMRMKIRESCNSLF